MGLGLVVMAWAEAAAAQVGDPAPAPALVLEMDAQEIGDGIGLLSVGLGFENGAGGGGGAGKVSVHDISITKHVDASSPKLAEACASGKHLPAVQLRTCKSRGCDEPYLRYELKNVMISSYQIGGSSTGDPAPTETLSLNFEEIKVHYVEQDRTVELKRRGKSWFPGSPF